MNTEKLIALVREHEYLYNQNHTKYSDNALKHEAWIEIAAQIRQPPQACKDKWSVLRDAFRRVLRKRKLKGVGFEKKWRYEEEMQFLIPHYWPKRKAKIDYFGWDDDPNSGKVLEMKFEDSSEDMNISDVDDATNSEQDVLAFDGEKCSQSVNTTTDITATPLKLINTFGEVKEEPKSIQYDEIDHFFLSMSAVLKTFPPYIRAITKKRLFDIVSEMEIEQLSNAEKND